MPMLTNLQRTERALEAEGLSLDDYEDGAVLAFVDNSLLSDSDELEDAKALIAKAKGYGEMGCWIYVKEA